MMVEAPERTLVSARVDYGEGNYMGRFTSYRPLRLGGGGQACLCEALRDTEDGGVIIMWPGGREEHISGTHVVNRVYALGTLEELAGQQERQEAEREERSRRYRESPEAIAYGRYLENYDDRHGNRGFWRTIRGWVRYWFVFRDYERGIRVEND